MFNNFQSIKLILEDQANLMTEDNFYFLQIIRRKKDNPDQTNDSRVISEFFIKDLTDLESKMERIIKICKDNNARAYFNPSPRSWKKVSTIMLKGLADIISNEHHWGVKNLLSSSAGQVNARDNRFAKLWIIDCDGPNYEEIGDSRADYIHSINESLTLIYSYTKNGCHIICEPFNLQNCPFAEDVKKNNPTVLYVP